MSLKLTRHRPTGLKKPRPLISRQLSNSEPTVESKELEASPEVKKEEDSSTEKDKCESSVVVFTLKNKEGFELILTGRNAKAVLSATNTLMQHSDIELVSMEVVCDGETDQNDNHVRTGDIQKEDLMNFKCQPEMLFKKALMYSKEYLIKLSQSKLSKAPPPLWNVLVHTHSPCCLPAEQVSSYFQPSKFKPHDGSYVHEDRK
ncbi:uncharacterized protein LOC106072664 isoform X1 [Biomphalaria glabrata]|uniref:Uncharacterized protein LOC106072664 isoform X1 n=1 Tax=Biomphalaria glabrata TaxID=6526 RepID=A0A9U8EI24_BIOGL|nr:uncharacterized protein LOC106072664 isoform X1 [Biomphalaria glabrata]